MKYLIAFLLLISTAHAAPGVKDACGKADSIFSAEGRFAVSFNGTAGTEVVQTLVMTDKNSDIAVIILAQMLNRKICFHKISDTGPKNPVARFEGVSLGE